MQTLQQELCQYVWSESLNLHLFIYLSIIYIHISWQSVLKEMFFIFLYFKDDFFCVGCPNPESLKNKLFVIISVSLSHLRVSIWLLLSRELLEDRGQAAEHKDGTVRTGKKENI